MWVVNNYKLFYLNYLAATQTKRSLAGNYETSLSQYQKHGLAIVEEK